MCVLNRIGWVVVSRSYNVAQASPGTHVGSLHASFSGVRSARSVLALTSDTFASRPQSKQACPSSSAQAVRRATRAACRRSFATMMRSTSSNVRRIGSCALRLPSMCAAWCQPIVVSTRPPAWWSNTPTAVTSLRSLRVGKLGTTLQPLCSVRVATVHPTPCSQPHTACHHCL